jgi:hypothetical protein
MTATNQAATDLKQAITDSLSLLRRLRDEIRVDIHLARMDAKDRWHELEPQFALAENVAHDISEASKRTVQATVEAFELLKASLTAKQ